MKIEIDAVVPEGYETTGEYRIPKRAEPYLLSDGSIGVSDGKLTSPRIILRKKPLSGVEWSASLPLNTGIIFDGKLYIKWGTTSWSDATCEIVFRPENA